MTLDLRSRLVLALAPAVLGGVALLALAGFRAGRQAVVEQVGREVATLGRARAEELDRRLGEAPKTAESLAASLSSVHDPASVDRELAAALGKHDRVYGVAAAFEPGSRTSGALARYVFRGPRGPEWKNLATPEYDYVHQSWYAGPVARGRPGWSDPYFDRGGGETLMVTYSTPIRRSSRVVGVATADVALDGLARELRGLAGAEGATAYLASRKGTVLAPRAEGGLALGDFAHLFPGTSASALADLQTRIASPGSDAGEAVDPRTGRASFLIELPLATFVEADGPVWSLVLAFPTDEILRPLARLRSRVLAASGVLAILLSVLVAAVTSGVTRPLRKLAEQAHRYSDGRYHDRLDERRGTREVRELSRAFNGLGAAILDQMARVRTEAEERARYQSELSVAADLQRALLPSGFPLFPDLAPVLDLHGVMQPAREIGGDLFDAFRLPCGRIALVVADVSGKGAPAALFTAQARLVVRLLAGQGREPGELLGRANAILEREIPSSIFVTLLYVEYDPATGRLRISSAGHLPPVRVTVDGTVEEIRLLPALPLAAMPGTRYTTIDAELKVGETLVLYTDGVTEAASPDETSFDLSGLAGALSRAAGRPSAEVAADVVGAVDAFAAGAPPSDDRTLLIARRLPGEVSMAPAPPADATRSIRTELPARTEILSLAARLVEEAGRLAGLETREVEALALSVDEVLANAIEHGAKGDPRLRILLDLEPIEDGLRVVVTDPGKPFDFASATSRALIPPSPAGAPGGLGLHLARRFVSAISYEPLGPEGNRMVLLQKRGKEVFR